MKTEKNLYERIYDYENLYAAYVKARENKRYKSEVLAFTANLEENLIDLQNQIIWQTYHPDRAREFYVYWPKKRLIMAPAFRDRVLQCAVHQVLEPIYHRGYIDDSFGSIKDRGPMRAAQRVQYWLRMLSKKPDADEWYILKADVKKFFFRIPQDVQLQVLCRKIKDDRLAWLLESIIKGVGAPCGIELSDADYSMDRVDGIGMPVGWLISQLVANVSLDLVDQYMKRELHVRYYARYMDDFILIGRGKEYMHGLQQALEEYLASNFKLTLNSKTQIFPMRLGVEFVGYRITADEMRLRKSTTLRIKRHLNYLREQYRIGKVGLEEIKPILSSYIGMLQGSDSYNLLNKILQDFVLVRDSELIDRQKSPEL